ncbi:MAG: ATP phosphoribosyltransferase regulatory subunit, partial [Rhodospirillaceae bacterium]|nr:ATP phosphoribosyltransferase regulatory subunit [Rhodospirillaceae bacterium]
RPIRLSYAGHVLRVEGTQLRPERQLAQAGAELIGSPAPAADAEIVLLAVDALAAAGLDGISVDVHVPTLAPAAATALEVEPAARGPLIAALDRKDAAEVRRLAGGAAGVFEALLRRAGPAEAALARLAAIDLPPPAAAERARLEAVIGLLLQAAPGLALTVDPAEHHGFEYHSGVSFTLFSTRTRAELGRGGRYLSEDGEPGTGVTLDVDAVMRASPALPPPRRVLVPAAAPRDLARRLREQGWVTVAALDEAADLRAVAARLGCTHLLLGEEVVAVDR